MGFMDSGPRIYNTMQLEGTIKNWDDNDIYTRLAPLYERGFAWDPKDSRLKNMAPQAIVANTPWTHGKSIYTKHCGLDHNIMFNTFNIIPPRCLDCWKVCVTLQNFDECVRMEKLQRELATQGIPCKCGAEMRDYTPKFFGAYFYTNSLDEGRDRHAQVVDLLKENKFSQETIDHAILKRGCTEFEMIKGPSPFWHITDEELELLELVEAHIDMPRGNGEQHAMVKHHVKMKWVLWAHMNKDMSYLPYNNNVPLFPDYVSYHDGDIDDIKHDLALARNEALTGTPPAGTSAFLKTAQAWAEQTNYKGSLGDLVHAFGSNVKSPLALKKIHLDTVPDENKGDLDESV